MIKILMIIISMLSLAMAGAPKEIKKAEGVRVQTSQAEACGIGDAAVRTECGIGDAAVRVPGE